MLGCSKDERDKLGRWQASQSDDYLRAARATVFEIQAKVAEAIRKVDAKLVEDELFDALRKYGVDHEIDEDTCNL
eukprot:10834546-Karenia_brevis.AAC.1